MHLIKEQIVYLIIILRKAFLDKKIFEYIIGLFPRKSCKFQVNSHSSFFFGVKKTGNQSIRVRKAARLEFFVLENPSFDSQ